MQHVVAKFVPRLLTDEKTKKLLNDTQELNKREKKMINF
jgi:hypothetical protein